MPIEAIKDLPTPARKLWEKTFNELKQKYSESKAARIAWGVVRENYKSLRKPNRKSMSVPQQNNTSTPDENETYIDVMLGYPGADKQVDNGDGVKLSENGWKQIPQGPIKGDMEHYYDMVAEGLKPPVDESWEGWVPIANQYWHGEDGALYARTKVPSNHAKTPEFMQKWTSGELGVSVEFAHPEEALDYTWEGDKLVPVVNDWVITGFSFTEDPAIEDTKKGE